LRAPASNPLPHICRADCSRSSARRRAPLAALRPPALVAYQYFLACSHCSAIVTVSAGQNRFEDLAGSSGDHASFTRIPLEQGFSEFLSLLQGNVRRQW